MTNTAAKPVSLAGALFDQETFSQAKATRTGREKPTILLVEDDSMTTLLLQRQLKDYTTYVAHTAKEALRLYAWNAPDICFLDIGLPDASGLELLEVIHARDPDAFAVMLTANSSHQNLMESVKNGVQGFIAKPFTLAKIDQYIKRFEQRQA